MPVADLLIYDAVRRTMGLDPTGDLIAMALYSIAILSTADEAAAIKAVRSFAPTSISHIRGHIGSNEPLITIDTTAFGIELDPVEGHKQQHAVVRAAIEQLKAAGCQLALHYRVGPDDMQEAITEDQLENFFAAELTYAEQVHD